MELDQVLAEMQSLICSYGGELVGSYCPRSPSPRRGGRDSNPFRAPEHSTGRATVRLQKGQVALLRDQCQEKRAQRIVFSQDLTPAEQRNLERQLECPILGRTDLILAIFAARALTHEGRLQVMLARLSWRRARLVRQWTHLERQRGRQNFVGGPGERQIELDRRQLEQRIKTCQTGLQRIQRTRGVQRQARRHLAYPLVTLVGYTNVGKTSLFNRLAGHQAYVDDMAFATLDPRLSRVRLPGGKFILLSDTVGFIRHLPPPLFAAFRATMEEARYAELILLVRDATDPFDAMHRQTVRNVLENLFEGQKTPPVLEVMNKTDALHAHALLSFETGETGGSEGEKTTGEPITGGPVVQVSALDGRGLDVLGERIEALLAPPRHRLVLELGWEAAKARSWLYSQRAVCAESLGSQGWRLALALTQQQRELFRKKFSQGPQV